MLSTLPHQLMFLYFPAAMAIAAAMDLLTMTIPNRLSAALALGYFAMAFFAGASMHDVVIHTSCGLAMLVLTFGLFTLRWIGGGDAKLAAATALWLGWSPLADYGLVSAIAGGALTIAILFARRLPLPTALSSQAWIARLHNAKTGIPYGIALALGGLAVYPQTQFWGLMAPV
jgi:prepilin peptidase CpaA